jgi:hypothetical protein
MKKVLIFLIFFSFIKAQSRIVFSEIMFYPNNNFPEFIEIYNTSSTDTIDINKYLFIYSTSKPDTIKNAGMGTKLFPKQYAVILPQNIVLNTNPYKNLIPNNALILKISDNYFGSSGMANTSDKVVYLLNKNNDTLEKYVYTANNKQGYSDEKIDVNSLNAQWGNSTILNGTPGMKNSIAPIEYDVEIKKVNILPAVYNYYDNIQFEIKFKNNGLHFANFNLSITGDWDNDDLPDTTILNNLNFSLQAKDSLLLILPIQYYFTKDIKLKFNVQYNQDEISSNNEKVLFLKPSLKFNDLIINEVMFYPSNGEPEWIEIYNNSNKQINLNGFLIRDYSQNKAIVNNDYILQPGKYIVVSKSQNIYSFHNYQFDVIELSNLPSLNNDYDAVVLSDNNGNVIDSLFYNQLFIPKAGFSIERILNSSNTNDIYNWGVSQSIEQSTPGIINSISPKTYDIGFVDVNLTNTNKFLIKIRNYGKKDNIINTIYIEKFNGQFFIPFDSINIIENTLKSQEEKLVESNISLGKNDFGIFKFSFNNDDENKQNNILTKEFFISNPKNSCLISEIMHTPDTDEPEWVEFVNISNENINLKNWIFSDITNPAQKIISDKNYIVLPNEYFIITYDSIKFKNKYNITSGKIIELKFNALSDDDGIILYDANKNIIDSINFTGIKYLKGRSLEKINLSGNYNDFYNWGISLTKSSPLRKNSYASLNRYNFNDVTFSEIMYNPSDNNCEFIELYNKTNQPINLGGFKFRFKNYSYTILDTNLTLNVNKYAILTANDSIFTFYNVNKDTTVYYNFNLKEFGLTLIGTTLYLEDAFSNVIDSMYYDDNMHKFVKETKGLSLEKINLDLPSNNYNNWGSCLSKNRATPFAVNSIAIRKSKMSNSNINILPNPFSPDNDGYEDYTTISLKFQHNINKIRIRIFDIKGRIVKTITDELLTGNEYNLIYDGTDDNNNKLPMGVYILLIESFNADDGKLDVIKKPFVIAKKFH